MPRLASVVIATYNRARFLGEAIDSVLCQTHPEFEVIVVDDGSTDGTRALVERYLPRVRYVWQPNRERGAARNHGLRLASGDFIAFLDSDDAWTPDKLERDLARFEERPDAGLVYSDIQLVDVDGRPLRRLRRRGHEGWVTGPLLRKNFVSNGAHLIRAEAVRAAGGFREELEFVGSEDWELWVRLSTRIRFAYVPAATARIRVHADNTTGDPTRMLQGCRNVCRLFREAGYLTPAQRHRARLTGPTTTFRIRARQLWRRLGGR